MLNFPGSSWNSGSIVLDELKLSNCLFGKTRQKSVIVVKSAGDEGLDELLCFFSLDTRLLTLHLFGAFSKSCTLLLIL